jgi:ribonucleoside-diphosphate reductase alpha chain
MVQTPARNALHELGYKIFLDRYAQKDMTRATLAVGDTVIVVVDSKTGQREIGKVKAMNLPKVTVQLLDGETVERDVENVDKPLETDPGQMMDRVAAGIAEIEATPELRAQWTERFRWLLDDWKFVPGGRILTAAGTDQQLSYYNCYVLSLPHDSRGGILKTLGEMTEIMSRGGGVGITLSSLRPRHAYVKGVNGRSSGAVSWGALYSFVTGLIEQGGSRRGALLLLMADWHPDVFEFINSKRKAGNITNANISVAVSDQFMETLKRDGDWDLRFPDTSEPDYDSLWDGDLDKWEAAGHKVHVYRTIKARELWDAIIQSAWASAEPGLLFLERYNKMANSAYFAPIVGVNPCVTGDTLVSTEFGYTKARDLRVGMQIRTPAGLKPIQKVYNNGVQRIYRVEFSDGGYLEGTADHKLKVVRNKRYEWVAVQDLQQGDRVQVMPNEAFGVSPDLPEEVMRYAKKRGLNLPQKYDQRVGFLVGVLLGDGVVRKNRSRNSYSYACRIAFGTQEADWEQVVYETLQSFGIRYQTRINSKDFAYEDGTVVTHRAKVMASSMLASFMVRLGIPTNVRAPHKTIPEAMMGYGRDFIVGLIDGLFSTDGSVKIGGDPMLRLTSASYELVQQVRLLLLQFGIHGRIYAGKRPVDLEYDGRSMYGTGVKYDLVVMNEGIARFYSEIGLSNPHKQARLKEVAENHYFMGETWLSSVVSVQDTEREEEVFDVYEPNTLTWVTNGYVSFDCGEEGLPANGVCNLGALNLSRFYDAERHDVQWDDLREAVRCGVRFLDNVVDVNPYFFEKTAQQQLGERRVGLGTMGLAELLIRLGIRYGSDESIQFLDKLYGFITTEAYRMSTEIAAEKGSFPNFVADKFLQSGFMKTMPEDIRQAVREKGIRNVTLVTVAPTGTTGTLVNTSTGIEPFFSWVYYRKSRLGLHEEQVPLVKEWFETHPGEKELPDYFVTAMNLSPRDHVRVQGAVQRWIDSSISKTANLPNNYTVEQVGELYEYMYELGCKGGTVYRDGSRDEQVLMLKTEEKKAEEKPASSSEKVVEKIEQVATPHRVYPRPKQLSGVTVSRKTPFGTAYITMNSDENHCPFEVFITVGKAGSDLQADAEGLGRMISLQLRSTAPNNRMEMLKLIVDQLQGIGGSRSVGMGPNRVTSLPDAVAGALVEHYLAQEQPKQLGLPINGNGNGNGNGANPNVAVQEAEHEEHDHYVQNVVLPGADICPSCGNVSLLRIEGCEKCDLCGFSRC